MGRRQYPSWSGTRTAYRGPPKKCDCCHKQAQQEVGVDFGYMSDDRDERYQVCGKHAAMVTDNLHRFLAHAETADKWRKERAKEGGDG